MDLHAVPATVADRPAVVATIVAAFANDPTFRFFFPDEATFPEYAAAFAGYLFDRRVHKGTVWICADGAVAALWDEPDFSSASAPHASPEPAQTPRLDLPEAEQELAAAADIRSIPTLMAFKKGYLVYNQAGALPPAALDELVQKIKEFDIDAAIAAQEAEEAEQA